MTNIKLYSFKLLLIALISNIVFSQTCVAQYSLEKFSGKLNIPLNKEELISTVQKIPKNEAYMLLKDSQKLAGSIISNYKDKFTYRNRIASERNLKKMIKTVNRLNFHYNVKGNFYSNCSENTIAYTVNIPKFKNDIWICPMALIQTKEKVAQFIIHEVAHLAFRASECRATYIEVLTLTTQSEISDPLRNEPYWKMCKTEKLISKKLKAFN